MANAAATLIRLHPPPKAGPRAAICSSAALPIRALLSSTVILLLLGAPLGPPVIDTQNPEARSATTPKANSALSLPSSSSEDTWAERYQHIAVMFEVANDSEMTAWTEHFNESLRQASQEQAIKFRGVGLKALQNVENMIIYVCDAIIHLNLTAFVAIGSQPKINVLSTITHHAGIPLLAYITEPAPLAVAVSIYVHPADGQHTAIMPYSFLTINEPPHCCTICF